VVNRRTRAYEFADRIATANLEGSTLIAVSGSRARSLADRQAFQDIAFSVFDARTLVKVGRRKCGGRRLSFYLGARLPSQRGTPRAPLHLIPWMS